MRTLAGREFLLREYLGYRNSIIKSAKKFNYQLLYERPMFCLQKIKEYLNIITPSTTGCSRSSRACRTCSAR